MSARGASSRPVPGTTASRSRWRRAFIAWPARCSCPTATIPTRTRRSAPSGRPWRRAAGLRRSARALRGRAARTGARYVHSADEPLLIAGVGTYALEVFEELPDADVIVVPLGGGSGACGLITVRNALGAKTKISLSARSMQTPCTARGRARNASSGRRRTRSQKAWRRGSASTCHSASTSRHLDDFVQLSEDELAEGVGMALRATHNLAEGAGLGVDCRGLQAARSACRQARCLHHVRRQPRRRETQVGVELLTPVCRWTCWPVDVSICR